MYADNTDSRSAGSTSPDASGSRSAIQTSAYLRIEHVNCHYAATQVISDLSFQLHSGEIGCLLGPSGCGKTSVLRCIAGFLRPTSGEIYVTDKKLSSADHIVPPEKRNLGMVYQDYALFPHLTVAENIGFGLSKKTKTERADIVRELLALVRLEHHEQRSPTELSGGQQQRVALARSLATNPDILLLDEPFSGLDTDLRRELGLNIRDILKERGTTALLVTHDQEEAFAIADSIGVMKDGRLLQWDTGFNLYHRPATRFVAGFVGRGSFIQGNVNTSHSVTTEIGVISGHHAISPATNTLVDVLLRPDDLVENADSGIPGTVVSKLFTGGSTLYRVRLASGTELETLLPSHHDYKTGDTILLAVEADHLVVFPNE